MGIAADGKKRLKVINRELALLLPGPYTILANRVGFAKLSVGICKTAKKVIVYQRPRWGIVQR
jgi:hypothetical protein